MDVASAIVGPVVNVLTGHIKQKLGYITSYAEHVEYMRNRMQFLEDRSADIERLKRQHPNMPSHVPGWLEAVKNIKEDVDNIPSNNIGCCSVKKKFLAGRNALKLTKVIERLIKDGSDMISDGTLWREAEGYLGRVDFKNPASTSTPGASVFNSRVKAFDDALKLLQQDDDNMARVIALCGMGGVGKTTLMKQLKEAAHDSKMFNWIVVVVIGKSSNLFAIQNAIAAHTGEPLTETDEKLRATYLSKRFKGFLERKEKILVILDDVWEKIKVEDIGLGSPLPNGVKLLLTSRDVKVCRQIAKDAALKVFEVDVLKENEAHDFFCQKADISAEHDHDLYEIGCEIVKKCGCLPLAIELIAGTLIDERDRAIWRHTRDRLKLNDLDENVKKIIGISYESIKREEDKAIFLLCGLFPEDSNIPIEDLTRYAWGLKDAWGLKLLKQVSTMGKARDSTQTSVNNLKKAYLLMDGDSHHSDCVKLHDLVLAFVVNTVSEDGEDGCWIIHHEDNFSNYWSEANSMSQSCKQISLSCKGMSEFPTDFKFPDLRFLKLVQGDKSLRFPQAFYATMESLQVIAFERMKYPLVPTSSTKLRTLCLDKCSLKFDLACIGNLSNLEVLSFANSDITTIPSTFGNLKKLRLLDVTGCCNLVIDDGVLKSLVKLEELYMRSFDGRAVCFTDNNNSELAERSKNLCALEFEFIGNNAHMKNVSFAKLTRFKISVGCYFSEVRDERGRNKVDAHSYQNSLKLITNKEEILKSNIRELFMNTDALYLQVNDMNTLEDVDVKSPHPQNSLPYSSFYNLRSLVVSECAELKYLFTQSVATNLSKLEYLEISVCDAMEAVIHTENNGSDIMFSNLKYLRLAWLPNLLCFCNNFNVIELPHLMELRLEGLPKITSIYPSSASSSASGDISLMQSLFNKEVCSSSLRSIVVWKCESLVNLLPSNPMPLFNHLEELKVEWCASVEVIFDIDMGCVGETDKVSSSSLRSINLFGLRKLREVWRIKYAGNNNLIHGFEAVESIDIEYCERFENLITPATTTFDMRAVESIDIEYCERFENLITPATTTFYMRALKQVRIGGCGRERERKNELGHAGESKEQVCSSGLRSIKVSNCDSLVNLFSCNLFPFLNNLQELNVENCGSIQVLFNTDLGRAGESKEQVCSSSLRSIKVSNCDSLVNLFSCNLFPFLNNLQELNVENCGSIQVLFNTDLGRAGESKEQVCSSSLRSIKVSNCDSLVNLLPSNPMPLFNHLEELDVRGCASVEVIFDINMGCVGETDKVSSSRLRSIYLHGLGKLREVWRIKDAGNNNLIHGFEAVERIRIDDCERFEKLITPATTTFDMRALKQVHIYNCSRGGERKDELVEKEISKIAFPLPTFNHLHDLVLLGYEDVEVVFEITSPISRESTHNTQQQLIILPNLEKLDLYDLEKMSHVWKCNWNELILQKQPSQSSFRNLTTITMYNCNSIKYLFSPLMVKLLSSLKEIYISSCDAIEEVVSNRDDEDVSINSHTTASVGVVFPRLKSLTLFDLPNFVGFFLGKNEFIWPTLENVEIRECPQITVSGPITEYILKSQQEIFG
ncbi:NB-ARC domains-containing protein [Artemisia annua]|uniref:NB-ARC domains-containing protein n=1 Tax=Artemisia annua TaxID=35608 RepID=A0A2U1PM07_ARTAN|nr:NB-ARC domains-containing protein [Artemisia annua]